MNRIFIVIIIVFSYFTPIWATHAVEYYLHGDPSFTTSDITKATLTEYYKDIPLNITFTEDEGIFQVPAELHATDCGTDFSDACQQWTTAGGSNLSFTDSYTNNFIWVQFTQNVDDLGGDAVGTPAVTEPHVVQNKIILDGQTCIYFNNCTNRGWTWSRTLGISGHYNFEQAALHELGHLLGSWHCLMGSEPNWPIMHETMNRYGNPITSLSSWDQEFIQNVMNFITQICTTCPQRLPQILLVIL